MQTPDGIYLEKAFEQSAVALKEAVSSLSEEDARRKPSPDSWSALDCIEHITLVDEGFSSRIEQSQIGSEPVVDKAREEKIVDSVRNHGAFKAPDVVCPKGRFATVSEALTHFENTRQQVKQRLAALEPKLRYLQVAHPVLGVISGYEAFLILPAHSHRHLKQILQNTTSEIAQ